MVARRQKVRLHFLIALTLAVLLFGANRFRRAFRRQSVETGYAEAEQELRDYASLLHEEEQRLADMAGSARGQIRRDAAALLMQAEFLAQQTGGARTAETVAAREQQLMAIRANLARLRRDLPIDFPLGRPFLRAYFSRLDDSYQPYSVCLPRDYDPERAYPLIVTLHGHGGFNRLQCRGAPHYEGAISVKPEGRGATDYMFVGEDDVMTVLEEVRKLYEVDWSRVYLVGGSMGGTGAWHLATHYPDKFTGIVPIAGNADHHAWETRWGWNAGMPETHADLRRFLHASFSPISYAENLDHCHVGVAHGAGDTVVPVEHARAMVDRLRELGHTIDYLEFPKVTHGGFPSWTTDLALARVMGMPPARTPERFRFKTSSLRNNRAWWVTVDLLDRPAQMSMVEAEARPGEVVLTAQNISALTLHLDAMPPGSSPVRQVSVNGNAIRLPRPTSTVHLENWDGQWRQGRTRGAPKRRRLSGPFSDMFRDPFIVVHGTQGDDEVHKDISRHEAERFVRDWELHYGSEPLHRPDSDVTAADMASRNLLLFGGPDVNGITAQIIDRLPVAVSPDGIGLGRREFTGEDLGVIVCYPNPGSRDRMVGLVAGTTPAALYQAYDRFGLWFNWGIYDKYKWFDYAIFDSRTVGPESFLVTGFFDNMWKIAPTAATPQGGGGEWQGDPAARVDLLAQGFPLLQSAAEVADGSVFLSDVQPIVVDQYRGAVGIDRTYAGRPIEFSGESFRKGLGVKAPSSLSFLLRNEFRTFSATVGLTLGFKEELSRARLRAEEVVFEVWGDSRLLARSRPMNWRQDDATCAVAADVTNVALLTLTARPSGGATWLYGGAAWGDPVVER